MTPPIFVAARELVSVPTDFAQDMGERATTLTPAPAIHQWTPVFWFVEEIGFEALRDISRDQRCAEFLGLKRRYLFVQSADTNAFLVAQDRTTLRCGQVIFQKFRRVMTVEVNYSDPVGAPYITAESRRYSQLAQLLRSQTLIDIDCWGQVPGSPIPPSKIAAELRRRLDTFAKEN